MSLREQQAAERRTRILGHAERIIRETAGVDLSMRALAAGSEVSLATPYNLFGSKEGLLYETGHMSTRADFHANPSDAAMIREAKRIALIADEVVCDAIRCSNETWRR